MLRQAFISHTGQDVGDGLNAANFATHLADRLRGNGIKTFLDHKSLEPGDPWINKISDHARHSQVMVVVLSPSYFLRYWSTRELDLALRAKEEGAGITIIPVYFAIDDLGELLRTRTSSAMAGQVARAENCKQSGGGRRSVDGKPGAAKCVSGRKV